MYELIKIDYIASKCLHNQENIEPSTFSEYSSCELTNTTYNDIVSPCDKTESVVIYKQTKLKDSRFEFSIVNMNMSTE